MTSTKSLCWIGEFPASWDVMPNKALIRKKKVSVGAKADDYPLLSLTKGGVIVRNLDEGGKFPENFDSYQRVSAGDLVTCLFDVPETPRTIGLSKHDGMITGAYDVFEFSDRVNPRYFEYYYLALDDRKGLSYFYSGLRNVIRTPVFLSIPTPVPPLDEQVAIADFLDRELAQIDALIEKQESMNSQLKLRVDRIILDAVTRGIEPGKLVPCEDSWLQYHPEVWTYGRLKNCLRNPVTDGPHTTPEFLDSGVPFLSVDGIQNGELVFEGCRYISESDDKEFRKKANPQFGDILMGKAASVGKIAQVKVDFPFAIWSPLALLKIDTINFDTTFVEFFLKSAYVQAQINAISNANTQQNLGMNQIPKLRFVYPARQEQTKIAKYLTANIELMTKQMDVAERVTQLLAERRQSLISAAVTGKIDVRKVS
jgi:type I restriction enzyme, S subunit